MKYALLGAVCLGSLLDHGLTAAAFEHMWMALGGFLAAVLGGLIDRSFDAQT